MDIKLVEILASKSYSNKAIQHKNKTNLIKCIQSLLVVPWWRRLTVVTADTDPRLPPRYSLLSTRLPSGHGPTNSTLAEWRVQWASDGPVCRRRSVFWLQWKREYRPLLINDCLFSLLYSGFQPSCHNIFKLNIYLHTCRPINSFEGSRVQDSGHLHSWSEG
jgi:hypothetical protein